MMIRVENTGIDTYQVTVESATTTQHSVTLTPEYLQQLTGGRVSAETLIEKSFEFLLERERHTSILALLRSSGHSAIFSRVRGHDRQEAGLIGSYNLSNSNAEAVSLLVRPGAVGDFADAGRLASLL
jgi:hypothetical protein